VFGENVVWAADCRSAVESSKPAPAGDEPADETAAEGVTAAPAAADVFSLPEF